jgi:hypothetical protein
MSLTDEQIIAHIEAHLPNYADAIARLKPTNRLGKREIAERRWQIYLLVLSADTVRGFVALLKSQQYRAAVILARCIFEYRIKAEYLTQNRREAYRQFNLIPARIHADLSKLKAPDQQSEIALVSHYLEWRRTAGKFADDFQGDMGASKMWSAITTDKKTDSDGKDYSPTFVHKYGIPSWSVHADAASMPDVFPGWNDAHDWSIREATGFFDYLSTALSITHSIHEHLLIVRRFFKFDGAGLDQLAQRSYAMRTVILAEWRRGDAR